MPKQEFNDLNLKPLVNLDKEHTYIFINDLVKQNKNNMFIFATHTSSGYKLYSNKSLLEMFEIFLRNNSVIRYDFDIKK